MEKQAALLASFKQASLPFNPTVLACHSTGITDWEVDMVLFHRLKSAQKRAANSITKFMDLVQNLTNIPVQDRLISLITTTLKNLQDATDCISRGDYSTAYTLATSALDDAETAFFDSEMMGLLYFPDEHKPAIYLPFFLPLTFPLIGTLKREYKRWKERKNAKKTKLQYLAPPALAT